ncbi:PIN domain-containing protein [Brevundimonas sp.]|uniref:PIN domain-containing protein n=1 Tax=Brevundimonas sp. TaxID=1871086 RepID=UPI002AB96448|nr:PIN domain-containing protein [Brevundimonas sp.]MDZ4363929.1 PIN domain-containing protein [Brevundimonas sp.]
MKVAIDTNVFGYAAGIGFDDAKRQRAMRLLKALNPPDMVMPSQVAGELYNILIRKGDCPPKLASKIVKDWAQALNMATYTPSTMSLALEGAAFHDLQIWDALILTIASEEGCHLLLSEDMQDGFVYRGVTVANPFAETPHPLLASLLQTLTE